MKMVEAFKNSKKEMEIKFDQAKKDCRFCV